LESAQLQALRSALSSKQVSTLLAALSANADRIERAAAVEQALRGASSRLWRDGLGRWLAELLPADELVPDVYARWRPLVRDSLAFVFSHLSPARLAVKIVEQIDLPEDAPIGIRLVTLIAKMPGLQKLGQVLARHRRLSAPVRRELTKLENGIADMTAPEVQAIVAGELGGLIRAYEVELSPSVLSEASVSAIIRFSWRNPQSGRREDGVFKVIKPHVPVFFAEDLSLLQLLAEHLATRNREYSFASRDVPQTIDEVRLLLEHEVDFRREQVTLADVHRSYRRAGSHVPTPITALCTDRVTAMSYERGVKVTAALPNHAAARRTAAAQIVAAVVADPMFSNEEYAIFHADPHAGNLLYDEKRRELIVLDWALTGRLSREQRRHIVLLILHMMLRDARGVRRSIMALSRDAGESRDRADVIDRAVRDYFASLPHACSLGALDAMRLLDAIGLEGVRFPAAMVLMRKVLFTLDGVLRDVAGDVRIDTVIAREFLSRWIRQFGAPPPPLRLEDYAALHWSAVQYATGLWVLLQERPAIGNAF
jgi:ubiquinone biosynthesis protein